MFRASLRLAIAEGDNHLLFGKSDIHYLSMLSQLSNEELSADIIFRGINEGRQCARDVDVYLMGVGTQLPKTGGIIQRAPYEIIGKPDLMKAQAVAA